jgi:hypothetical protein
MTMDYFFESPRKIPIISQVDVLIIGGGPSGLAAAVSARKMGINVMVVERYGFLGGAATAGYVGTICGLYVMQNGRPFQLVHGFADQFLEQMATLKGMSSPLVVHPKIALLTYDLLAFKEIADKMILQSGAHILFHNLAVSPILDGEVLKGVIIENKEGRQAIYAKVIIDASGDADIAYRSGVPCAKESKETLQHPTMTFRLSNVDLEKARKMNKQQLNDLMVKVSTAKRFDLPRTSGMFREPPSRHGQVLCNMNKIGREGASIDGTDSEDLTFAEIEGRRQTREYARFLKSCVPGFENAFIEDTATQIGIRETRRIVGEYILTKEDILASAKFEDAVACNAWPLEIHSKGKDTEWIWLEEGKWVEIPYRCLVPKGIHNLLVAGRCISTSHEGQASIRAMGVCMALGQAAGVAAAISIIDKHDLRKIPPSRLRQSLLEQGVFLG